MQSKSQKFGLICLCLMLAVLWKGVPTHAQATPPQKIESDDATVAKTGTWLAQAAPSASGSNYLYNASPSSSMERESGSEVALALNFSGPSLEVIYVAGPALGTLAIEVDGTVLRTVITTNSETAYGQSAKINYLTDEPHELKVYAQGGSTVAIDAFIVGELGQGEPVATENTALVHTANDERSLPCNPTSLLERIAVDNGIDDFEISADGRYVVMLRDGLADAQFSLYDRETCTAELILTVDTSEISGYFRDVDSFTMSGDTRYISYGLHHNPSFPGTAWAFTSLHIYDRTTEQTATVPQNGSGVFSPPAGNGNFSADGQIWAIASAQSRLAIRNQANGAIHTVRVAGTNATILHYGAPVISGNGRYIAFASYQASLVPDDTNAIADIFRYDWYTQEMLRVSVSSAGDPGSDHSEPSELDISADGRYITFVSRASNLVPDDTNAVRDLFVHDTQTATTTRISVGPNGEQNHNGIFGTPTMSADGRYISFQSSTAFWTPNDTNGFSDVFLYDRQSGGFSLISAPGNGVQANDHSYESIVTEASAEIVFWTEATNLDSLGEEGIFVSATRTNGAKLALFRPDLNAVGLVSNLTDLPSPSSYMIVTLPPPASGQWLMGDWDGNGSDSPGVYGANGVFYYTNEISGTATWSGVWVGLLGRPPVAGRFDAGINHDCIGAVDSANFPPYGTAFALYFTCDLTPDTAPPLSFQWLSVILPDSGGFTGTHQFAAGDFDNDGTDSIAIRRGEFIAFTNVPPTTLLSDFSLAQFWGTPPTTGDEGIFLTGDFDNEAGDSFGVFYQNGHFYYRNTIEWSPSGYELQRIGQPLGTPVAATSWH